MPIDESELVEKMLRGELKPHEVEAAAGNDSNAATRIRREFLARKYNVKLGHIGESIIDFSDALNRNIENPVGAVQVPLGYAGDIKVNGEYANGTYPILMATTEGRLVAGTARGIGVFNKAGGITTTVMKDGMTRDILMRAKSVRDAAKVARWIMSEQGFKELSDAFSAHTEHGKLKEVKPYVAGRDLHARFKASTGSSMGMNMLTIASSRAADEMIRIVGRDLGVELMLISESGNMCTDKKPAYINFIEGRGTTVVADATVSRDLVLEKFKVTPELIADMNKTKNLSGSALAGTHGGNAHVANILAAMYIAYGQDVAQIVEGSQALVDAAVIDGNLYVSCYMPAIEVGTYGGGTKRETQREALELLGLYGAGDNEGRTRLAFAEVVAASCLAGEINLIAIEAAGQLAKAHGEIKRG